MRLRIAFIDFDTANQGQRQIMPNAYYVTDEYMEDEHDDIPKDYSDDVQRLIDEFPGHDVREMFVEIPDAAVTALFATPTVTATTVAPVTATGQRVLVQSDCYNAHYLDGTLVRSAKPDYLDIETLATEYPDAEVWWVPQDVYDTALNGDDYPQKLTDFPLAECRRNR